LNSVPVTRATDNAKPGTGYVYITGDDPLILRGVDTKFIRELAPRRQIVLSKTLGFVSAEVLEVISDTEAKLKREFGKEGGKGTSKILERLKESSAPGLSYKVVPYVDQQEMYMHVYEKLKNGGCVGIFPEGVSEHFIRSPR
jgi:glycerol-3-phosphate O-acyltransferase/dihydroxyacetone phosphate acyltransferase